MSEAAPSPGQKALQLNIDTSWYGTLAEIGAGQEVAREHLFETGLVHELRAAAAR